MLSADFLNFFRLLPIQIKYMFGGKTSSAMRKRKSRQGCGTSPDNKLWLNLDVCGLMTAGLVYSFMLFSDYNVTMSVIVPWFGGSAAGWLHGLLFNTLLLLAGVSHARTMLSNPGAVPPNARPVHPSGWARRCKKCDTFKPERAHHCSICDRCIIKMDHHCPWVNNCVGLANHKFFMLFLIYTFLSCCYAVTLIIWRAAACAHSSEKECEGATIAAALVLVTAIIAVMFGLFTMCMMCDQTSVILTNQTQIDRLKSGGGRSTGTKEDDDDDEDDGSAHGRYRLWHNLSEVFGGDAAAEGFKISWLLPTPITYPNPEALTGYCFRDTPKPRTQAEMEMV